MIANDVQQGMKGGGERMEKVTCPKCNYEWETNSDRLWVTCPNCMRKFEKVITKTSCIENGKD